MKCRHIFRVKGFKNYFLVVGMKDLFRKQKERERKRQRQRDIRESFWENKQYVLTFFPFISQY